jgi:oxalate decarboxylase/phosphoglucose isomerase-like protein (cupin superfamily)
MGFNPSKAMMTRSKAKSYYERWMEKEAVPILGGFGVTDVRQLPLRPWKRLGCEGAYLQLRGLDGITGLYVGKIAPDSMTEPEKHLYEEVIYVIQGQGVAEIQQRDRVPQSFTWQAGSLFSPPLNATHRLINHSNDPAVFIAVTTAPMVLDHFHNEAFVFHSDFSFSDRYDGDPDYFEPGAERYWSSDNRRWIWETNLIRDARTAAVDGREQKGAGLAITQFEMSNNALIGHLAEWPVGRYQKAHYHGGGVILVVLRSEGYSLMWPNEWGTKPYQNGYGDRVVRVDWQAGSVFSPPANWFHQHFNAGSEPALQLALRCGSQKFPLGVRVAAIRAGVYSSVKQGATLIEYLDEDPEIRRIYRAELEKKGIAGHAVSLAANDH